MTIRQASTSTEYIKFGPVEREDGSDPTTDVVRVAFVEGDDPLVIPEEADWQTVGWEPGGPPYLIRALVGPDGIELEAGVYIAWVDIVDSPETFIRPVDRIVIY
jgi:hypothetical protein